MWYCDDSDLVTVIDLDKKLIRKIPREMCVESTNLKTGKSNIASDSTLKTLEAMIENLMVSEGLLRKRIVELTAKRDQLEAHNKYKDATIAELNRKLAGRDA